MTRLARGQRSERAGTTSLDDTTASGPIRGSQTDDGHLRVTLDNSEGTSQMTVGSFALVGRYNADQDITDLGQVRITPPNEYVPEPETHLQAGTNVEPGESLSLRSGFLSPGGKLSNSREIQDQPVQSSTDIDFEVPA